MSWKRNLAAVAVAFFLLEPGSLEAASRKKSSATKKSSVTSKARKTTSKKAKTRARRSPRQQTPTPERYREIQQALADKGFYDGPINGAWGAESIEALKRFQTERRLDPDGKIGALSLIALGLGPKRDSSQQFAAKPEPQQE